MSISGGFSLGEASNYYTLLLQITTQTTTQTTIPTMVSPCGLYATCSGLHFLPSYRKRRMKLVSFSHQGVITVGSKGFQSFHQKKSRKSSESQLSPSLDKNSQECSIAGGNGKTSQDKQEYVRE